MNGLQPPGDAACRECPPSSGGDALRKRTLPQADPRGQGRTPARRTDDPTLQRPALERPRTPSVRDDAALSPSPPHAAAATPADRPAVRPRRLASGELLAGATEIEIEHGSAVYRLRLTSLGKLILTK